MHICTSKRIASFKLIGIVQDISICTGNQPVSASNQRFCSFLYTLERSFFLVGILRFYSAADCRGFLAPQGQTFPHPGLAAAGHPKCLLVRPAHPGCRDRLVASLLQDKTFLPVPRRRHSSMTQGRTSVLRPPGVGTSWAMPRCPAPMSHPVG